MQTHERQHPGDEDLMELAEAMTLQTAGRVWVLPPAEIPGGAEIAGLTRF